MDLDLAQQRVAAARVARLATVTPEGRPHLVPVCFALLGGVAYTAIDAKPKATLELQRLRNIGANPATSLLIDHFDEDWQRLWWVRLDGSARIATSGAETEQARNALTEKYVQYETLAIPGPVIAVDVSKWVCWP